MKRKISLKEIIDSHLYKTQGMTIKTFHFNPLQVNTYVLHDETREAVLIDPGNFFERENEQLREYVEKEQLTVRFIVNTHAHVDHVCGNQWCVEHFSCPVYMHEKSERIYRLVPAYGSVMGMGVESCPKPSKWIEDGETLSFGQQHLQVLYTPGHADGSVCLYLADHKAVFVGDVLFAGSVGRTDLPTGSFPLLIQSIKEKLMTLPDETTVFCGHDINTTIGYEKSHNQFIQNYL